MRKNKVESYDQYIKVSNPFCLHSNKGTLSIKIDKTFKIDSIA